LYDRTTAKHHKLFDLISLVIIGKDKLDDTYNLDVDHLSISRIIEIRKKLLLSTKLFFRSEMNQGSAFCMILHSHAHSVSIGNTLTC
jgi:hypothetical protein